MYRLCASKYDDVNTYVLKYCSIDDFVFENIFRKNSNTDEST